MTFSISGIIVDEGYQLNIAAVLETDKLVFCFAVCMSTSRAEGEILSDPGGRMKQSFIGDKDNNMVEMKHFAGNKPFPMLFQVLLSQNLSEVRCIPLQPWKYKF